MSPAWKRRGAETRRKQADSTTPSFSFLRVSASPRLIPDFRRTTQAGAERRAGGFPCALEAGNRCRRVLRAHLSALPRHAGTPARCAGVTARCAGTMARYRGTAARCRGMMARCVAALRGCTFQPHSVPGKSRTVRWSRRAIRWNGCMVPLEESSAPLEDRSVPRNHRAVRHRQRKTALRDANNPRDFCAMRSDRLYEPRSRRTEWLKR